MRLLAYAVWMGAVRFYEGTVNAATYDSGVGRGASGGSEDLAFYVDLATESGPDILELGSGTGRLLIPLVEAGFHVTGLDRSTAMLRKAESKLVELDRAMRERAQFVEGDLASFELDRQFDLILAPARVFAFLLTIEDQRSCLNRVFAHLRPGGRVAIHLFDPRLDLCTPGRMPGRTETKVDPDTGQTIRVDVLYRDNDTLKQIVREVWRFTVIDPSGAVVNSEDEQLELRWTYRYEMRHLLELSGFVEAVEYSDFDRSAPAYGAEQVWVARRPADG